MGPSYFQALKAEVGRLLHDLSNQVAIAANNARFLDEACLPIERDQEHALRDTARSTERAAELLRELQAILG